MDWEIYKKDEMEKLSKIREYLGNALDLIEEMRFEYSRNLRFNISKSKGDIEYEMFALSRTGEEDESIYKDYSLQHAGLPVEGFEYVDVKSAVRVRCLFPDGMRTFYLDEPIYWVNKISIREHLERIQDEIDQDQIVE